MTKIIKSYYKLINNFQDDLKGSFLTKIKRRRCTLNLLAWRFILNRVKPVRLDDLLLSRLKRRSINSFYTIQLRKLRFFYGFYRGYKSIFFKRLHRELKNIRLNRIEKGIGLLELRLDTVLVRIGLFSSVLVSRRYIGKFGLVINDKVIYDANYVLKIGDFFSVLPNHKIFFKLRLLFKLNPARLNVDFLKNKIMSFLSKSAQTEFLERFIFSDIKKFNYYDRVLSSASSNVFDLDGLRKGRSVFFLSYLPRFLEFNFKTFEFLYSSPLRSFSDIKYPFKLRSTEVKRLIESTF